MLIKDQMGRSIDIPKEVKRIISLVPSQTELLFDLGLKEELVGITKFCIHPLEKVKMVQKIGGTKQCKIDLIRSLEPDLIIGNKEENEQTQIELLAREFPVWMSDIYDLSSALDMISSVGAITGKGRDADQLSQQIKQAFSTIKLASNPKRVAYFIWQKPYMVAAGNTFINEMLKEAGYTNVFEDLDRYPAISLSTLAERKLDCIFLSSEPFPFKEKHFAPFQEAFPNTPIKVVDGEYFSWYGSRLMGAPTYFNTLQKELNA